MGLGPVGGIEGKVNGIVAEVKIGFDTDKFQASLDEFHIINAGHISFHFNGNPLIDWLLNLLTEVVTTLLKDVILLITETIVSGGVQSAVDAINDIINGIINPTTTFVPRNVAVEILGAVMDTKN
ncbi:hypothetical protein BDFB_014678 [Asbolus verrucosus]|uniref:Uncharacterized protein n=1 Tax=Asbolus verrucosus TaxID=1661398 RepID=A0A482VUX5_ASBVE|nr:hypothetical protein BDFB_014678 [Asbolus verrucosus]